MTDLTLSEIIIIILFQVVHVRKGAYLEAPVDGSRPSAKDRNLVVMAAGDKSLYDRMEPIFRTIGKQSYFLGKNIIYRMY